ncbi:MAG: hypothetical protein BGO83_00245 [Devosia sp. 66-14]|nr:MAG: hypothetical protein BGO83_00245 [Devosia sp. 66-14]
MTAAIVAFPSSGATRHLLPDGEKNPESAVVAPFLSPSGRGWIGRRPRRVRGGSHRASNWQLDQSDSLVRVAIAGMTPWVRWLWSLEQRADC